jgi:hypothetical protein
MKLNRRELLKLSALAGGGLLLPIALQQRSWGKEIYQGGRFPQDPDAELLIRRDAFKLSFLFLPWHDLHAAMQQVIITPLHSG